jgi:hypothetical protein
VSGELLPGGARCAVAFTFDFDAEEVWPRIRITMHPQVIGRPSRLRFLDRLLDFVRSHEDVWIATCAEIAAAVPTENG